MHDSNELYLNRAKGHSFFLFFSFQMRFHGYIGFVLEISFQIFFFFKNHFMGFWSDMESNKTPLFQVKSGGKKKKP